MTGEMDRESAERALTSIAAEIIGKEIADADSRAAVVEAARAGLVTIRRDDGTPVAPRDDLDWDGLEYDLSEAGRNTVGKIGDVATLFERALTSIAAAALDQDVLYAFQREALTAAVTESGGNALDAAKALRKMAIDIDAIADALAEYIGNADPEP